MFNHVNFHVNALVLMLKCCTMKTSESVKRVTISSEVDEPVLCFRPLRPSSQLDLCSLKGKIDDIIVGVLLPCDINTHVSHSSAVN